MSGHPLTIGFTYDLKADYLAAGYSKEEVAEFDNPDTIDGIEAAIRTLGHRVDRIGKLSSLVERLARGDRWDLVFNQAEGLRGLGREAAVPALLEGYGIPATFGDSLCLAVCLHKGHAKRIVQDVGIPTPAFALVEDEEFDFEGLDLAYPLFVKPVAEGTGKGITDKARIHSPAELRQRCLQLVRTHNQPVLVEEYLPGREFTVGILGTGRKARVVGVMEVVLNDKAEAGAYTFANKDQYEDRVSYHLAEDAVAEDAGRVALAAYQVLGCRDSGRADIRCDSQGKASFMEINPLAGMNPVHSDLPILCRLKGIPFEQIVAEVIASASQRIRPAAK